MVSVQKQSTEDVIRTSHCLHKYFGILCNGAIWILDYAQWYLPSHCISPHFECFTTVYLDAMIAL